MAEGRFYRLAAKAVAILLGHRGEILIAKSAVFPVEEEAGIAFAKLMADDADLFQGIGIIGHCFQAFQAVDVKAASVRGEDDGFGRVDMGAAQRADVLKAKCAWLCCVFFGSLFHGRGVPGQEAECEQAKKSREKKRQFFHGGLAQKKGAGRIRHFCPEAVISPIHWDDSDFQPGSAPENGTRDPDGLRKMALKRVNKRGQSGYTLRTAGRRIMWLLRTFAPCRICTGNRKSSGQACRPFAGARG